MKKTDSPQTQLQLQESIETAVKNILDTFFQSHDFSQDAAEKARVKLMPLCKAELIAKRANSALTPRTPRVPEGLTMRGLLPSTYRN